MIILWWLISEIAFEDPRPNDTVCHRLSLPSHLTLFRSKMLRISSPRGKEWLRLAIARVTGRVYDTINKEYNINTLMVWVCKSHSDHHDKLYSECHETLLPQRESFEGDREKAITRGATWKRDHPDDGLSVSERNIWCWESTLRTDRNPSGFKWSYHTAFNIEPFILHSPLIGSTQMVPTS